MDKFGILMLVTGVLGCACLGTCVVSTTLLACLIGRQLFHGPSPRSPGGGVLRERRRLQLSGRLHRRLATVLVRVLEPRNEGGGAVQPQLQYEAVVIERAVMLVCYGAGASVVVPSSHSSSMRLS